MDSTSVHISEVDGSHVSSVRDYSNINRLNYNTLSWYTYENDVFMKTRTKRWLRQFFELTMQTRQGRAALYRLYQGIVVTSLLVYAVGTEKSSRHTSRRCIYSASRKDLSLMDTRARLIIARPRVQIAA